ncbi:N-acetylgalactosamine-6-sulfatase [Dyadobacter endophyticus]|uniref:N-acetylgalactosamine-6-sulfatase n=1 Tax=Dyadobacter endophyticus TaxID=1749036 RepID=A0ABQ1YFL6_9BACT|nr:sulfatase-like hydrolase/transferase [Dyadobacter endophyticus]GGH24343.1 N-acetylgalactosamine-6-sulfatase [Dyadobacter endophyticus]
MKNARIIRTTLLALCATLFWNANAQVHPNIVFILADDQGWGDLSINGNTNVRTPHIDRIGKEGAQFSRFYVSPLCAPTRAGLLTGRYHYRAGVWGVSNSREFMNLDEVTLADLLKSAGYSTGCFGKWHNGSQYPYHPNGRGFDEFYGMLSGHYANYFNTTVDHNGEPEKSTGYIADDLTSKAIGFIEKSKKAGKPFFCYIPYNTPHSPFQVPDENYNRVKVRGIKQFSDKKGEEDGETTITALAMSENIDDNVGRILKKLDDLKLTDNTIVIYLSDNGPNSWRWNGDMKGRKGTAGEGSVRVPFLIRWPGVIPAGKVVNGNAAYIDLLPTLIELTGVPTKKSGKPLDGISLQPALTKVAELPDRLLFLSINKNNSVRKGHYLYQSNELYDLAADPAQQHNIASGYPGLADSLRTAFDNWYADVYKNIDSTRSLPVGYSQFPKTVLPSQDAILHRSARGSLSYSASAPNSSWISNWSDTASYASWNVEVHTTGRYQVNIRYTSADAGDAFTIALNKSHISGSIPVAFDPPLIPSPDRVKRTAESYEKEFRTLKVGEMRLEKGKGELKLSATELKGGKFADIRSVELVLLK